MIILVGGSLWKACLWDSLYSIGFTFLLFIFMTLGCFTHCPASWHPFPLFWQGPGWVGWFGTMGWLVFMVGVGKVPSVGDSFFVLQENSKFSWKLFLLCSLHYHIAKEPFFFSFFFSLPQKLYFWKTTLYIMCLVLHMGCALEASCSPAQGSPHSPAGSQPLSSSILHGKGGTGACGIISENRKAETGTTVQWHGLYSILVRGNTFL